MSDLRERVAMMLAETQGEIVNDAWRFYLDDADAAIALVLDEAAKVAEDCSVDLNGTYAAIHIAAAIRALKEKSDD